MKGILPRRASYPATLLYVNKHILNKVLLMVLVLLFFCIKDHRSNNGESILIPYLLRLALSVTIHRLDDLIYDYPVLPLKYIV